MGKYFGTDGVRGVANKDLTPELAYELGRAAGVVLSMESNEKTMLVGKDTRISGDLLEMSLISGLLSVGINVIRLGVIPTPGVAFLTRKHNVCAGVMISASHNPFQDNGIKFFSSEGYKLPDDVEEEIESILFKNEFLKMTGNLIGRVAERNELKQEYIDLLTSTISSNFKGMKLVVDCANGAAYEVAKQVFDSFDAEVTFLYDNPDGVNINVKCGSTHPESLQNKVLELNADVGIAFDGDADRLIAVDNKGNLVDGDDILFICAVDLYKQGKLKNNTIVATVMSNFGFKTKLNELGIQIAETKVGDRYVIEEMLNNNYVLGGEQSGHVIFKEYSTTGDGILTSLQLLDVISRSNVSLSELKQGYEKYPQYMINVAVEDKYSWETNDFVMKNIRSANDQLKEKGRILIRPSGTESLVRVMAEGKEEKEIKHIVDSLAEVIKTSETKNKKKKS